MAITDEARAALARFRDYQRTVYGCDRYDTVRAAMSVEQEMSAAQRREMHIIAEFCPSWPSNRRGP